MLLLCRYASNFEHVVVDDGNSVVAVDVVNNVVVNVRVVVCVVAVVYVV